MNDATFTARLSSVMLDNKYDRYVKGRRSGKLDTKGIYKISISDKLFKRKEERKNKHYAVSLVVDCSGSMMSDGKYDVAFDSAKKLSWHLSKIGIPHNIVGFNGKTVEVKSFNTSYDKQVDRKLRKLLDDLYVFYVYASHLNNFGKDYGDLVKPIKGIKDSHWLYFGNNYEDADVDTKRKTIEKIDAGKHSSAGYKLIREVGGYGYNNDPVAIEWATKQILKQKGKKIMIVLSDGQPAISDSEFQVPEQLDKLFRGIKRENTKHEVEKSLKQGIELYSIGILDGSVSRYYPAKRCCSVYDLHQLYDHIIKMISINLKRG